MDTNTDTQLGLESTFRHAEMFIVYHLYQFSGSVSCRSAYFAEGFGPVHFTVASMHGSYASIIIFFLLISVWFLEPS